MLSRMQLLARNCLKKHPVLTNSAIYGSFYVAAEYSQQKMSEKYLPSHPEVNYSVLPRFAFMGSCIYSPMLYYWYSRVLDKYFIGRSASVVVKKVLLDQLIMTPILLVAFYTTMSILERREDVFEELKAKFTRSFIANQQPIPSWLMYLEDEKDYILHSKSLPFLYFMVFWIPAQTVNFALVPQQLRVVFVASASFIWINMLCWIKRSEVEVEDDHEE